MSDDLVKRLRALGSARTDGMPDAIALADEAAARIATLEAAIAAAEAREQELRAAVAAKATA